MEDQTLENVRTLVKEKLHDWYEEIESVELEDLRINIFLASMMGMEKSEDLVRWYFRENIERKIVTSFGFLIEKIAQTVCDAKSWTGQGADIVLEKDGEKYYIEVKSGTASSNVKMMRNTSKVQSDLKEEVGKDITTALGLTYGKKEKVFGTMTGYYKGDKMLVGQEFWEFLTGDESAHEGVLNAIREAREEAKKERAAQVSLTEGGQESETLNQLIQRKEEELIKEWEEEYGEELTYKDVLNRLF